MPDREWNFVGGSATAKQRNYISMLARQAGYADGVSAAAAILGRSRSKLQKKGLDLSEASEVISKLKQDAGEPPPAA